MIGRRLALYLGLAVIFVARLNAVPPKVIAHRGYWNVVGSAQNSIRSLVKADSIGCYASEFDVRSTKDGLLVINHDSDINGLVIENTHSDIILMQKLPNGEYIPTLDQFLDTAKMLKINLICEIKEMSDSTKNKSLVKKVIRAIRKKNLSSRVQYVTFSPEIVSNLVRYAPKGTDVFCLRGLYAPAQLEEMGATGFAYNRHILKSNMDWIREARGLGLSVGVATVSKRDDLQWWIRQDVDYITTNEPEMLIEMLRLP